ncbi:MAG: hypothetical protein CSA36_03165 [Draconibacterium sp.]|nr:MAG: hypothetical protein CSA36_03165 [Draconibacterium sp.]
MRRFELVLAEVVSYGDLRKYQSGVRIETLPSSQLQFVNQGGIDQVLMRLTPVYVKTNAGGLSTIRFRGTSPNHTSIHFGGINVNSLTLGHSNLSALPSFLFDTFTLQYGSSSSVNGSGAIGGSLYLGLSENWTDGWKLTTNSIVGSFGEYMLGAKVFVGNGRWESVSRIYGYEKENNFPFLNKYTGDIENPEPQNDVQHGASLKNGGILQEFNYRFSPVKYLKTAVWLQYNWNQIQPSMPVNLHYLESPELEDTNLRIWSEFVDKGKPLKFRAGAGFVHDMEIYNHQKSQYISTNRFVSEIEISSDYAAGYGWRGGTKYRLIKPRVHAYADSVINLEQHFEFYLSGYYHLSRRLRATVNLRQMLVTGFKAPFTPSAGFEYVFRTGNNSMLSFTSSLAKSYRIPTFNDRYWGTQGNPNLKSENGNSVESGLRFTGVREKMNFQAAVNVFYMHVKNWIEWRNMGEWVATNVKEVVSKGIETQLKSDFFIGKAASVFSLNYTFNPVRAVEKYDEPTSGRQMIYSPKNMASAWLSVKWNRWTFFTDSRFIGTRYPDDFNNELPAYFLLNSGVSYLIGIKQCALDLNFSVNNVLDTNYQNERYYAMPGRFFRLALRFKFEKINS